jgi:ATP-dependent exoDNAse (exonuclease V) beta subunit
LAFNHVKLPELDFELQSQTTEAGREYVTPIGKSYPSVTTVLSDYNKKALFEWRERVGADVANKIAAKASSRGTKLHTVCENYLLNEMTDDKLRTMMPDTKQLFMSLRPYLDENIGDVYCIEQALYSKTLRLAGRVDCIAEWNGQLSVIDFKSSTREKSEDNILNYFMQCTAYAEMFGEITGKPINQIVVAIAVEDGSHQIFVREKSDYYIESLQRYIGKYWRKRLTNK